MRWALALLWLIATPALAAPTSWTADEAVVANLLDAGMAPATLKTVFAKQDKTIDVSALRLGGRDWLVTLSRFEGSADVFALAPSQAGYATVWRLGDAEARARGDLSPLLAWTAAGAASDCRRALPDAEWANCGPIGPEIGALPSGAGGAARFWLIGTYAQEAGETESAQLSLWRWDGRAATPLLVRVYQFKIEEDEGLSVSGDVVRLQVKDDFKTMLACGACSGRQRIWRLRLTRDGAVDLGKRSAAPELDLADDVFDRAVTHKPLGGLAGASAARTIARHLATNRASGRWPMGTLEEWILSRDHRRLCVATDGGGTFVLTLARTDHHAAVSSARYVGDGLCHDSVHWTHAASGS
jgi:hypothetical protein